MRRCVTPPHFKSPYIPSCVCLMIMSQDVRSQRQCYAYPSDARLPAVVVTDSNPLKPQSPNKLFCKLLGHGRLIIAIEEIAKLVSDSHVNSNKPLPLSVSPSFFIYTMAMVEGNSNYKEGSKRSRLNGVR